MQAGRKLNLGLEGYKTEQVELGLRPRARAQTRGSRLIAIVAVFGSTSVHFLFSFPVNSEFVPVYCSSSSELTYQVGIKIRLLIAEILAHVFRIDERNCTVRVTPPHPSGS